MNVETPGDEYFLINLIDRASAVISAYCGQTFGLRRYSENFHLPQPTRYGGAPTDTPPLILTGMPVVSIESVTENGTVLTGDLYELNGSLLYRMNAGQRIIWTPPSVVVAYTCGYVLPGDAGTRTLPYDLETACLTLIQGAYYARGTDPSVVQERVEGVGQVMYDRAATTPRVALTIDPAIAGMLQNYCERVW